MRSKVNLQPNKPEIKYFCARAVFKTMPFTQPFKASWLLLGLIAAMAFTSCSKDTMMGRFYHNTTARFNGYYNALTKYDEAVKDIRKAHKDDFSTVIPLEVYGSQAAAANFYPQFDIVIKKSSAVIQDHDISKWVDNSFLLIGKAYFMKKEYFEAIESFQYVYTRWKREPIADEALLWLIRSYIESGQYAKAQGGLDVITNNKSFPKELRTEYHTLRANLYLAQKRWDQAVQPIQQLLESGTSRNTEARAHFILGQIYAMNNPRLAGEQFRQSLKKRPVYEMQFQARMQIARLYDGKNVTSKQAKNQLRKLLKDEKNKDYFDEIYYELAMLAFKEKDLPLGINYLKLSTASSTKNTAQKSKSYLALAEHYFKQQDYSTSQLYYDSTAGIIAKEHPKFKEVQGKKEYLGDLVRNLQVVYEQDSLLALAKLPESQLNKIIDKAIKEERKRKDQERFEKEAAASGGMNRNMPGGLPAPGGNMGSGGSSEWYFYNQQTSSLGYSQFVQRWGNRELADDWRRSKKEKIIADGNGGNAKEGGDGSDFDAQLDAADPRSKYMARIPRSKEAQLKAKEQIQEALFALAALYREKLDDYPAAISYYEKLLKEHAGHKREDEVLYRVGLVYELTNKAELRSTRHKQLTDTYPESPFSKLLLQPESIEKKPENRDDEACEKLYEQAYKQFETGKFREVVSLSNEAITKYPGNKLLPNFEFLAAMCQARVSDSAAMKTALMTIVARYPDHPVGKLALEMIDLMDPVKRAAALEPVNSSKYKSSPEEPHFYIVAIDLRVYSQHKEMQLKLANFNDSYFRNNRLRITTMLYGKEYQLLVVRELPNERKALEYAQVARDNKDLLKDLPAGKFLTLIASKENFNEFYKSNELEAYKSFHDRTYSKP